MVENIKLNIAVLMVVGGFSLAITLGLVIHELNGATVFDIEAFALVVVLILTLLMVALLATLRTTLNRRQKSSVAFMTKILQGEATDKFFVNDGELGPIEMNLNSIAEQTAHNMTLIQDLKKQLSVTKTRLKRLASIDSLTGLPNRRKFNEKIEESWARCYRDKKTLGIMLLDVDHFVSYNEGYGTEQGDDCLRTIGKILLDPHVIRREGDISARFDGGEFVVLMEDTQQAFLVETAKKIQSLLASENVVHEFRRDDLNYLTVSVGICFEVNFEHSTIKDLIQKAREALSEAKKLGRNQIVVAQK